jgi:starch-binding outer membrane protein, SusD/RagB family
MKTTKIKFLSIAIAIFSLGSCSENFLELEPKALFISDIYYKNEEQATGALAGVYDVMRKNSGGFFNMIVLMNASSDDFYAGGEPGDGDDRTLQGAAKHDLNSTTIGDKNNKNKCSYWNDHYQGITRANTLIEKLPDVNMSNELKIRFAAECKALRAIYYFNLVRMFKNIPLIVGTIPAEKLLDIEQSAPEVVYAQIEQDLLEAIAVLPGSVDAKTQSGRLTKGGVQAMLGKVYLFENKKTEAASVLEQVNGTPGQANQYGNKLLSSFSSLWIPTNKFNTESLIEVSHTALGATGWGNWGKGSDEANFVCQMVGPRSYIRNIDPATVIPGQPNSGKPFADTPDIVTSGWSFSTVTEDLYDAIKSDPRFGATVLDLNPLKNSGHVTYKSGAKDTGYFLNKFLPTSSEIPTGGGEKILNYRQNSYLIRLADTYLMEAEALGSGARAQALLDAVRARVGLPSVTVSLTAIKNERRMELAGEGQRFFDLVRWGDATAKLASRGFSVGEEIFPIPLTELQGTKLKQNPGYN